MALRERFTAELKTAMLARDAARVATLRMVTARLKDADIAARPKGVTAIPDDEIVSTLKAMIKSRRESLDLYVQGKRQDLADKEQSEIDVITEFLPAQLGADETEAVVRAAIAEAGATTSKDMGRVMAILKAAHPASLDMSQVNVLVKKHLS